MTPAAIVAAAGGGYPVYVAPLARLAGPLAEAGLTPGPCMVVSEPRVWGLHGEALLRSLSNWQVSVELLPEGEAAKTLTAVSHLFDRILARGIERTTPVFALGGGALGDAAGFAAATLLRGLPLVHLPTTLIAQTDSAIGGKTGLNHASGKNLIGSVYPPRLVVADPTLLATLDARDRVSGFAETIKHALIGDPDLIAWLETHLDKAINGDPPALAELVRRSASIKARVVSADEREDGARAHLNFGHTFAHAIEQVAGYGAFRHGEAVALGMRAALYVSRGALGHAALARAEALVARIPVPAGLDRLPDEALLAAMRRDKKNRGGKIRLVVLTSLGEAALSNDTSDDEIREAWGYVKSIGR